jgi:hypothetical protein
MPSWAKLIHVKKSPVASTRRYHHIGIPTTERREGERLIEHYATFVSGYETSAYGIEWMRFEAEAPVPELVRTVPHVAFEVDDLSAEIAGKEILIAPNSPSPGVTVAFIVENGAPVEFLQFDKKWCLKTRIKPQKGRVWKTPRLIKEIKQSKVFRGLFKAPAQTEIETSLCLQQLTFSGYRQRKHGKAFVLSHLFEFVWLFLIVFD